jgi:hypothetical protein
MRSVSQVCPHWEGFVNSDKPDVILLCDILVALSMLIWLGCDSNNSTERSRLDLFDNISENRFLIDDNTDVYISGIVEFTSSIDSSVIIGNGVEFIMDEGAQLVFNSPPIVNSGSKVMVRALSPDLPWTRIQLSGDGYYVLSDWRLQDGKDGLVALAPRIDIRNCEFVNFESYGLYNSNADSIRIENSLFDNCRTAIQTESGVVSLVNTNITDGEIGIFRQRSGLIMEDCLLQNFSNNGIRLIGENETPGFTWIEHCTFDDCNIGIYSDSSRPFNFRYNVVKNCNSHDLYIKIQLTSMPFTIEYNQLLDVTDEFIVRFNQGRPLDVTRNYWGNVDSTWISDRIFDHRVDSNLTGIVTFMPPLAAAPLTSGRR